jgi:type IV secretory pathway VirB9-like protein
MTTATFEGRRIVLSIAEKARMLKVIDIGEENCFAVPSGTDPRKAYAVQHDGKRSTYCPCPSRVYCAYRLAVDWKLQTDERTRFNYYELGLGA